MNQAETFEWLRQRVSELERENEQLRERDYLCPNHVAGALHEDIECCIACFEKDQAQGFAAEFEKVSAETDAELAELRSQVTTLSRALQTARHALEWIANGASRDPQRYAKSAIADLDQPEPASEPQG